MPWLIKNLRPIKLRCDNLNCCPFSLLQSRTLFTRVSTPAPCLTNAPVRISLYYFSLAFTSNSIQLYARLAPECGKGFRYKVSQRSHKCPGVLVKQPGELIQKLMQNSSILLPSSTVTSTMSVVANETTMPTTNVCEISILNPTQQHESHDDDLCLDDLLREENSYDKLIKSATSSHEQLIPQMADNAFDDRSAVLSFQNMTINMNYDNMAGLSQGNNFSMSFPPTLETINEDSIKELLGALR